VFARLEDGECDMDQPLYDNPKACGHPMDNANLWRLGVDK